MKKLITSLVLLLSLVGCTVKDKYVRLSEETLPKTVMIQVDTIAEVMDLKFEGGYISIEVSTKPVRYLGAGVLISPNGHILSVNHLIETVYPSTITVHAYNGEVMTAELLCRDVRHDLALFKVDHTPQGYAKIGDPRNMKVGQEVMAIGNPVGLDFTVTTGIISRLNRDLLPDYYNLVQTDTAINPGNSGGPLFNMDGEIVGIVDLGSSDHQGLSFCVDPGQLIEFITRFKGATDGLPSFHMLDWKSLEALFKGK